MKINSPPVVTQNPQCPSTSNDGKKTMAIPMYRQLHWINHISIFEDKFPPCKIIETIKFNILQVILTYSILFENLPTLSLHVLNKLLDLIHQLGWTFGRIKRTSRIRQSLVTLSMKQKGREHRYHWQLLPIIAPRNTMLRQSCRLQSGCQTRASASPRRP